MSFPNNKQHLAWCALLLLLLDRGALGASESVPEQVSVKLLCNATSSCAACGASAGHPACQATGYWHHTSCVVAANASSAAGAAAPPHQFELLASRLDAKAAPGQAFSERRSCVPGSSWSLRQFAAAMAAGGAAALATARWRRRRMLQ